MKFIDRMSRLLVEQLNFLDIWQFQSDGVTVYVLGFVVAIVFVLYSLSITMDKRRHGRDNGKTASSTATIHPVRRLTYGMM